VSSDVIGLIASHPCLAELRGLVERARRASVRGSVGSSTAVLSGALARARGRPVLLAVAHVDEADESLDALESLGVPTRLLPALESLPGESGVSIELLADRLNLLKTLADWRSGKTPVPEGLVIVAPIQSLMQAVPAGDRLGASLLTLRAGEPVMVGPGSTGGGGGPTGLLRWLDAAGYRRTANVEEPGDYAVRGGIIDLFPPGSGATVDESGAGRGVGGAGVLSLGGTPVRLDFFGDELEKVSEFDLETLGSDRTLAGVRVVTVKPEAVTASPQTNVVEALPAGTVAVLHELMELTEQGRGYYERCADARSIFGPPAVFKALRERLAGTVEVSQFAAHGVTSTGGGGAAGGVEGGLVELPLAAVPALPDEAAHAVADLVRVAAGDGGPGARVVVLVQNDGEKQRLGELIDAAPGEPAAKARIAGVLGYVPAGFIWTDSPRPDAGRPTLVIPYHEVLQRLTTRRQRGAIGRRLRAGRAMDTFLEVQPGDYVVHSEHGIARYLGLKLMKPHEAAGGAGAGPARGASGAGGAGGAGASLEQEGEEYLTLEFDGGTLLHVPAVKSALVQKYVGGYKGKPPLSTIGGTRWKNQKERVGESVRDLAAQMLRLRAAREHLPGIRFPGDTAWQREFEAEFPYEETEDQLAALTEIKRDMSQARPMDRLLCGDVGYGKTEVAIRAAFKAVEFGKQAAVLVPTTVLAEQHERTFRSRFKDYPFRVASVSRFKSDAEVREVLAELAAGRVDVIIGTHRLLSKDVKFADLGLVVIDEEQRFGVEHKERLLALRMTADVLTLSATPIPRTLHMSMLGLRDISSLTTAPADRRAVVTELIPYNPVRIKQVIERELAREGQVYYVHNRVHDILSVADDLQKLVPHARIVVGHGQMPDGELEEVMLKFMRRPAQADILVSTTIIESGIDNPHANTMIIEDADRFGLADLHQLRGRVGRYKHRAYCYLLLPEKRPVKDIALQRLKAVEQFSMLGAGFKIAMRDLEIRGAGNILGPEQSGHIAAVGYDMYCQLLDRAVKDLRHETVAPPTETSIEIGVRGVIPRPYIPSDQRRLEAYRRVSLAGSFEELDKLREDLAAAYGKPPKPVEALLDLAELRIAARAVGIRTIMVRSPDAIMRTDRPDAVLKLMQGIKGSVRHVAPAPGTAASGLSEIFFRPASTNALEPSTLLLILRKRLRGGS
jgi:transcription-repair coupling factor (superfamily II helicase)